MRAIKRVLGLITLLIALLTACSNTVNSNYEMLQIIKEEENISVDIRKCGVVVYDDKLLMLGITGESEETYNYYAANFSVVNRGKYKIIDTFKLINIGWQLRVCKWQNGYVVVCNNDMAATFRAVISLEGNESQIITAEILSYPWVHYIDLSDVEGNYDVQHIFLDKEGKEIK